MHRKHCARCRKKWDSRSVYAELKKNCKYLDRGLLQIYCGSFYCTHDKNKPPGMQLSGCENSLYLYLKIVLKDENIC